MRAKLFFVLVLLGFSGFATHNRSGYISYCWLYGNTYHFKIYTYTNYQSVSADRCSQTLFIDNTDSITCPRTNGTNPCPNGGNGVDGVEIVPPGNGYGGVKENIYEGTYILNPGVHVLSMIDPNRDAGIINLGGSNSQNIPFALVDTVYIYNIVGVHTNCTPTVTNPPIQNACAGQPWYYNPGFVDPENDSLVFSKVKSFEDDPNNPPGGVQPIATETFPANLNVDPNTGTVSWLNVSSQQGEYNFAVLIKEYRKNPIDGLRYLVGETVFDIQILVVLCSNPDIVVTQPANTCIIAGQNYSTAISASSGGSAVLPLHLSATGLPLTSNTIGPKATFTSTSGNTANGTFNWTPSCMAVHSNPYYVTFQATDSNTPLANANFSTFNMLVISPPPSNVVATPQGSFVNLSWNAPSGCGQTSGNTIQKYFIYRNDSCNNFTPAPCKTGVPSNTGYALVGTTPATTFTFTDTNFGQGLPSGNSYSYIVVAQFADGSLSIASPSTANTCVTLKLDIPLMMKVSVDTTDAGVGRMLVWWKNPFTDATGLDTNMNPGPYKYILQRKAGSTSTYTPVYTVTETSFNGLKKLADTTFTDTNIDTQTKQFFYTVDFYGNNGASFLGSATTASSVFLTATPHDKRVDLSWNVQVPWKNIKYYILKQRYGSMANAYDIIDSTTATNYTVKNLENKYSYCFKILSKGLYANNKVNPFPWPYTMNFSEKVCSTPFDDSPPCQPVVNIWGDGTCSFNTIVWSNPNHTCGINDVLKYYVYYSDFKDSTLVKIDSLLSPNDTSYTTGSSSVSIAGCYVIVAVDSAGNHSPLTNEICTDNCPEYDLANIFTPNGDNINDLYNPVKNRYIKSVEFTMYNRWGEIVFETTDPALKWDGKSKQMKQPVSDGTYYYICKVNELHYYGIKSRTLKGFVQVLH
ncbi:MAG TPA: gliding motility-associated C-terminal domain-containing protein [Bacteroidia bacterium]|jgi:gliding motility-associated-like protein|nr:gliding motility-associated C-terminal domain-containing protein [Bacteroidia bacterium]